MSTVIPQGELTKRAMAWICESCGPLDTPQAIARAIEQAAMRFNLGPLEVEFLERFYKDNQAKGTGC